MLGHVGVSSSHQHPPVPQMGHCVPDFLAVDNPRVTVFDRSSRQPSEVTASSRFAKQLTPTFLTGEHRTQEPVLRLLASVSMNGWTS